MANHCLICGNPESGKKYLINHLVKNAKIKTINNNQSECTWNIANKYYESDVTLTIINSTDSIISSSTQFSAIILVLNMNQSHSVIEEQLNEWFDALSPYLSDSECNLLIGNYVNSYLSTMHEGKQRDFHKFLHEWSVDNCFEFVPSPFESEYKLPLFESSNDSELSHYRIDSALQCVMWPNMTRRNAQSKHKETKQEDQIENDDAEFNAFQKGDKVKILGLKSKPSWNGKVGEIAGHFSRKKKRWPIEVILDDDDGKERKKALLKAVNLCLEQKDKEEEKGNEKDDDDKEKEFVRSMLWNNTEFKENDNESLEHQMGSFQSLIDEMQRVRNDAKSGKLTDDERRQKAADTAMKLMSYMGLEDGGDYEESADDK